jgi:hypothetical protein
MDTPNVTEKTSIKNTGECQVLWPLTVFLQPAVGHLHN